jgi:hypothetical protein
MLRILDASPGFGAPLGLLMKEGIKGKGINYSPRFYFLCEYVFLWKQAHDF